MHDELMTRPLDRRAMIGLFAGAAALGVPALRAAGQATPSATPAGGLQPDGSWEFVDDAGETLTRDTKPERIVAEMASAAALWHFGIQAVGAWGPVERADGSPEVAAEVIDLDAVELLGEGFEDFDVEKLVALRPDLIVTTMYGPASYWRLDEAIVPRVREIAPMAGIQLWAVSAPQAIRRFEDLAGALGADLESDEIVAQRTAFEQASEDVRAAVAENPNLRILVVSGADDMLYIANPEVAGDLMYFRELGVDVIVPDAPGEYWEALSWEQAGKYPADVVLVDTRLGSLSLDELMGFPTFASHPAVVAGQVGTWEVEYVVSYTGFTPVLQNLAATIRESRADVVE